MLNMNEIKANRDSVYMCQTQGGGSHHHVGLMFSDLDLLIAEVERLTDSNNGLAESLVKMTEGYADAEQRVKGLRERISKMLAKHQSCHTMEFKRCEICDDYEEALKAVDV